MIRFPHRFHASNTPEANEIRAVFSRAICGAAETPEQADLRVRKMEAALSSGALVLTAVDLETEP